MTILHHSMVSVGYLIRGYPLKVVPGGGALVWDHVSEVQVNHHPIEGRDKSSATKHTGELDGSDSSKDYVHGRGGRTWSRDSNN